MIEILFWKFFISFSCLGLSAFLTCVAIEFPRTDKLRGVAIKIIKAVLIATFGFSFVSCLLIGDL